MPRRMDDPDYVYTPRSADDRRRLSLAHKHRLGIPPDCVRIYGVHVPEEHAVPIRHWANWMRQRHGWDAASDFVRAFVSNGFCIEKPSPDKRRRSDPNYCPQPLSAEVRQRISEGVKRTHHSIEQGRFDWPLVTELMGEGMSLDDVALFLSVSSNYLERIVRNRRRAKVRGEL